MFLKLKKYIKKTLSKKQKETIKSLVFFLVRIVVPFLNSYGKYIKTPYSKAKNKNKKHRKLEIGPGPNRIKGFETVNILWGRNIDYVADASKALPFPNDCFSLIYASHILEHVPWYKVHSTIREWNRILKPGGIIEIWVPNGFLIAKTWIDAEDGKENLNYLDGWYKFNPEKDPGIWANGRIFSYGDGTGLKNHPNWHLSLFSERLLIKALADNGFRELTVMDRSEVRGHDHGWINLGVRGTKS